MVRSLPVTAWVDPASGGSRKGASESDINLGRETDAVPCRNLGRIYADHLAHRVQEWATTVAGIDGGICLNQIRKHLGAVYQ